MSTDAGMDAGSLRVKFVAAWALLLLVKLVLATALPLFVDEAFYGWEGRHLAWAYSDLPGLTAWLTRLGQTLAGDSNLALRAPFLLMAALIPWQVVWLSRRWFGPVMAWQAGLLALALPLTAVAGVLALPDVPLVVAALLCVDAVAQLQQRVTNRAALQLALGLVLGAWAHYRFAAVIVAGGVGVLLSAQGRALLRSPPVWAAVAVGALAWWPLLAWNANHAAAGLQFQLVERHPWRFHADGIEWLLLQAVFVTPGLLVLLLATQVRIFRRWREHTDGRWGLLLGAGAVAGIGFFPLAFFVDSERLSLHWPHAGWLLLTTAAPVLWADWSHAARRWVIGLASAGVLAVFAYLAVAAHPGWRAQLAHSRVYPDNFAGWPDITAAVAEALREQPGTRVLADNFKLGAQLAVALGLPDGRIAVLEHPLNEKHGRAAQLREWGLLMQKRPDTGQAPVLLVVEDTARALKDRLAGYHQLCRQVGTLPPAQVLNVDHGRKRFLLYRLPTTPVGSACVLPAIAWIDTPVAGATVGNRVEVSGWAFKDGSGIAKVEILLDGVVRQTADYGRSEPGVAAYWKISSDPQHPRVGFRAELDLHNVAPGRHWLGLRLHGNDGSHEDWPEQPITLRK